ncbi:hypothetical protein P261_01378 [Lachnospiraceae bacterium TWA4]|nr:hypothetical protein P261_01378 [Lachnospiraceae bacterium TWA4]
MKLTPLTLSRFIIHSVICLTSNTSRIFFGIPLVSRNIPFLSSGRKSSRLTIRTSVILLYCRWSTKYGRNASSVMIILDFLSLVYLAKSCFKNKKFTLLLIAPNLLHANSNIRFSIQTGRHSVTTSPSPTPNTFRPRAYALRI